MHVWNWQVKQKLMEAVAVEAVGQEPRVSGDADEEWVAEAEEQLPRASVGAASGAGFEPQTNSE